MGVESRLSTTMASQGDIAAVEVYTTNEPVMAKQIQYKGMILLNKTKSRNMFSDIGSGFKSMVGGEVKGLTKLTKDTRQELMEEAKEKAAEMGANAVCGIRFETTTVFDGAIDILVYGTAVLYKRN